ncbi:type I-E CRISPR-associated protein Cse2/CasB [Parasaccharibacter sp. TMW 2.1888]|uniref:type I-E CRISPR-associated protein Cse2/CasB n=1 Tax=Parasaccharibacter sp. TMW 2.1888 TaxID=2268025 RepID=UPI002053AEF5|nr:type I-E CRISPR-associated protein Cse2/CasB [Parasaccharibacter sp. TMW 2.1888]UPO79757.1 type I-E CRISPR-associated protein Cse2/CasB [Parasaccharibacter sp. TMW 2.1888]
MSEKKDIGVKVFEWWQKNLAPRTQSASKDAEESGKSETEKMPGQTAARTLSAKLRRGGFPDLLFEPEVHHLVRTLNVREHELKRFCRLVEILGSVRTNSHSTLAERLRGADKEPLLSPLRFKQLMTAEDEELAALLRRAVQMAEYRCNVAALARDVMFWNDRTKTRWCLDYFGAANSGDKTE